MLELLERRRIVVCAGAGGVGKTTTAAAVAMGMAERGLKVAVVTIDPARRLADSLGLDELDNEPRLVDPARFAAHGIEIEGELWAMVLDTPPSRNALDFLDAPGRLTGFFQGRAIRMFLRPAGLLGRGSGLVFAVLRRVTGVDLLRDLSGFFRSLGGLI